MSDIKLKEPLPEKLSDVILAALDDLEAVRKREDVDIDLSVWTSGHPGSFGGCSVCFAGAVMIGRAENEDTVFKNCVTPGSFDRNTRGSLLALDFLRSAYTEDAIRVFYEPDTPIPANKPELYRYRTADLDSPNIYRVFVRQMRAVAEWLKGNDL